MTTIVSQIHKFATEPSLVIVIDCWATNDPGHKEIMDKISNFCLNSPGTQAIALATYVSTKGEKIVKEEPWYSNSKSLFYDRTRWEPLRDVWENSKFIECADWGQTDPCILNMPDRYHGANKNFFILWHHDQLAYYINYVCPSIKNIIVTGFTWKDCLKWRSMGHDNLARLVKYKIILPNTQILTNKNLVGCEPGEDFELYQPWQDMGDDWFRINFDQLDY